MVVVHLDVVGELVDEGQPAATMAVRLGASGAPPAAVAHSDEYPQVVRARRFQLEVAVLSGLVGVVDHVRHGFVRGEDEIVDVARWETGEGCPVGERAPDGAERLGYGGNVNEGQGRWIVDESNSHLLLVTPTGLRVLPPSTSTSLSAVLHFGGLPPMDARHTNRAGATSIRGSTSDEFRILGRTTRPEGHDEMIMMQAQLHGRRVPRCH
jgi:hypothetical protein